MSAVTTEAVTLKLPPETRYIRVARLVASGVAAMAGFDLDGVEDLRIAVDELCATLVEVSDGAPVELSFRVDTSAVEVHGVTSAGASGAPERDRLSLSEQILQVVCDEHELTIGDGRASFRLRKQVADQVSGAAPE